MPKNHEAITLKWRADKALHRVVLAIPWFRDQNSADRGLGEAAGLAPAVRKTPTAKFCYLLSAFGLSFFLSFFLSLIDLNNSQALHPETQ
jgi:hypothetical protein